MYYTLIKVNAQISDLHSVTPSFVKIKGNPLSNENHFEYYAAFESKFTKYSADETEHVAGESSTSRCFTTQSSTIMA